LQYLDMDFLQAVHHYAKECHGDQQRKYEAGPYIIHLERVRDLCQEYTNDQSMLAAALLHDVLEDTPVTKHEMKDHLSSLTSEEQAQRIVSLVVELTDVFIKSNYPQWNRRRRKQKEVERLSNVSADAQTIKYADIIDNSLTILNATDDFARVYLLEARALVKGMKKGKEDLRQRAIDTIEKCLMESRQ
jgi:(p)ppGpp synthase/HD superfamily hydrolase